VPSRIFQATAILMLLLCRMDPFAGAEWIKQQQFFDKRAACIESCLIDCSILDSSFLDGSFINSSFIVGCSSMAVLSIAVLSIAVLSIAVFDGSFIDGFFTARGQTKKFRTQNRFSFVH
jgi:hypothetical protein